METSNMLSQGYIVGFPGLGWSGSQVNSLEPKYYVNISDAVPRRPWPIEENVYHWLICQVVGGETRRAFRSLRLAVGVCGGPTRRPRLVFTTAAKQGLVIMLICS